MWSAADRVYYHMGDGDVALGTVRAIEAGVLHIPLLSCADIETLLAYFLPR